MKIYTLTLALVTCLLTFARAQKHTLFLQNEQETPSKVIQSKHITANAIDGHYYAILQFNEAPSADTKGRLAVAGIKLTDYVPNLAWLSKIPVAADLTSFPEIRGIITYQAKHKVSPSLLSGDFPSCHIENNGIAIYLEPFLGISIQTCADYLKQSGFVTPKLDKNGLFLVIPHDNLLTLAKLDVIKKIYLKTCTPEAEGLKGQTLVRANYNVNGLNFNGKNIGVAIGDDGSVNHQDIKNRVTDHTTTNIGSHADMTVGLAIGSGNINPKGGGMASGANLHLYDIEGYPHIINAPQNYIENDIVITSTSYGDGCGGIYSYVTEMIDNQVYQNDFLFHSFSAGNRGFDGCNSVYGQFVNPDGTRYGNITGGYKAGKNTVAVGNLYYNDSLRILSSRGPTEDGRIKPDVCAPGQGNLSIGEDNTYQSGGGTSAASPVVAGAAAILYQAYKDENDQNVPNSGLIKGILLNTAEDLGTPGPDYKFGWGRIHVGRSLEVILEHQYISGTLQNNFHNFHQIPVPENVGKLNVMVYWVDPAASFLSTKALVNDLDITLEASNQEIFQPLVLSTVANYDSIIRPASPGIDRVNNMEQVTLHNPNAGFYTLKVKAHLIPEGVQEYFVIYSYEKDEIKVSYPCTGEGFEPNITETLRWDAYGDQGHFVIEYSTDNQVTWHIIADSIAGSQRYYDWYVPHIITNQAFIRVRRNNQIGISEGNFSIIEIPQFEFDYVSENTASMSWNSVEGAVAYEIFAIGEKYMEVIGQISGNTWHFPMQLWESNWFSIRAIFSDTDKGPRAYAKQYTHRTCNATFGLNLKFDLYPGETSWEVKTTAGELMYGGGPYNYAAPNSLLSIQKCLPFGCYNMYIYDSYDDGMCCDNGEGWYEFIDQGGEVLTSGGEFTSVKILYFCLEDNSGNLGLNIMNLEDVSCAGGSDGGAMVSAHGGEENYTYTWSNGTSGNYLMNVPAGTYGVTISDGEHILSSSVTINEAPAIEIVFDTEDLNCTSLVSGAIMTNVNGGTAPYSYFWNIGLSTPDISSLFAGNYTLSVVDANGCLQTQSTTIAQNNDLALSINAVDPTCFGASNGLAVTDITGGSGAYTYLWNTGANTANIFSLTAGDYAVTVTDNNANCMGQATINIVAPPLLSINPIIQQPNCSMTTGTIDAIVEGGISPYMYSWNIGQNEAFVENLPAGNYTISVVDANGCPVNETVVLTMPEQMTVSFEVTNAVANNDGAIDLQVGGGTAPYTYLWSNSATTATINNLSGGVYSVTITDATGCQTISQTEVNNGDYCLLRGSNTTYEWIDEVHLNGMVNNSGPNGGLGNYSNTTFTAYIGTSNNVLKVVPDFQGAIFSEYWKIWIDLNGDFDFSDPGEEVYSGGPIAGAIETNIFIPSGTAEITTTMRIAMKYGSPPPICGTYGYGEVEMYSILLKTPSSTTDLIGQINQGPKAINTAKKTTKQHTPTQISVYPNPASEYIQIRVGNGFINEKIKYSLFNMNGNLVKEISPSFQNGAAFKEISIANLPQGVYRLELSDGTTFMRVKVVISR